MLPREPLFFVDCRKLADMWILLPFDTWILLPLTTDKDLGKYIPLYGDKTCCSNRLLKVDRVKSKKISFKVAMN